MEERITFVADQRGGRACIRDTRVAVNDVLGWLASGMSSAEICADNPELQHDDLLACLSYSASQRKAA